MRMEFQNLYDSHIHLQFTAEKISTLDLSFAASLSDLKKLSPIRPENFRGQLLTGFGWSPFSFDPAALGRELDAIFPDQAIFFTRKDGHAALINSQALKLLGLSHMQPGLVEEEDHFLAYKKIPAVSDQQLCAQLLKVQKLFLSKGFTHVRDMTMNEVVWSQLEKLSATNEFQMAVEAYIHISSFENLEDVIATALRMKSTSARNLRLRGVKFFYDGTLGAHTALLSCGCGQGLRQWSGEDLAKAFQKVWSAQLEVAVHTIGDLAVDEIVNIARTNSAQGHLGRLCLEHVEVVKPETVQKMKPLHVEVHMQPCHFLSDREFLKDRLGKDLSYAFPWNRFERAQIPMFFGSDSPIEMPDFFRNLQALKEAKRQFRIETVQSEIADYHTHPDKEWWPSCTVFENEQVSEIQICGQQIKST